MKRILLLDEEFSLAKEVKEGVVLRKPEVIFDNAYNYKDAYNMVKNNVYDIILIDVVIPIRKEDFEVNNKLIDSYSTGIIFKNHILEEGVSKAKLFLFTSRSNLDKEEKKGTSGVIDKPKRPSQIVKQIFDE